MLYDQRFLFIYRAHNRCEALSLNKRSWRDLNAEFEYFADCFKINILSSYSKHIRTPLIKKKAHDIVELDRQSHYEQYMVLEDLEQKDFDELRKETQANLIAKGAASEFQLYQQIRVKLEFIANFYKKFLYRQERIIVAQLAKKYPEQISTNFKINANLLLESEEKERQT